MEEARTSLQALQLDGGPASQVTLPTYPEATEGLPTYAHATDLRTLMRLRYKPREKKYCKENHGRHTRNLREFLFYIMCKDYDVSYNQTQFFHIARCFRAHSAAVRLNMSPSAEETRCIQELIYGPSAALGIPIAAVWRTLELCINSSQDELAEYEGCLDDLGTRKLAEKICIDLNVILPAISASLEDDYVFSKALDRALERYFSSLPASLQSTTDWASNLQSVLKQHREAVALVWQRKQEDARNREKKKKKQGKGKSPCREGRQKGEDESQSDVEQPSPRKSRFRFSGLWE